MKVDSDITPASEPDRTTQTTNTGEYREDTTLVPGSPEYLGEMAKRGGASDDEVQMIMEAARKSDPTYEGETEGETTESNEGETEGETTESTLSLASLSQEVIDNDGKLTESSMNRLIEMGFAQDDIENYIAGQYKAAETIRDQTLNDLYAVVGGQDKYDQMIQWAATNLTKTDIEKFNTEVSGGNIESTKAAIVGLKAKYTLANGATPKRRIAGNGNGTASTDVYRSQAQLTADMNNPKYAKDQAFRDQVMAKLGRSPGFQNVGPAGYIHTCMSTTRQTF